MSRIGKKPINVPLEVAIKVDQGIVFVSGPKGNLELAVPDDIRVEINDRLLLVHSDLGNLHGLFRTLINNMIIGVTTGWTKVLELSGTGYRASVANNDLNLALGFSHPVVVKAPDGITFEVKDNKIVVKGANKVKVGEIAAKIRSLRPADPYKAKGLKYENEVIRRKQGKAVKAGATATVK